MQIAIGLGSNLGDSRENILTAVRMLEAAGFANPRLSTLYETVPVDCVPGTPNFINATAVGHWQAPVPALLTRCKAIEEQLGRPRIHSSSEARVIDLDILLVDGGTVNRKDLRIPHPQMHTRLFVLLPLCEIIPDWVIPTTGKTVAEAAAELKRHTDGNLSVWQLQ